MNRLGEWSKFALETPELIEWYEKHINIKTRIMIITTPPGAHNKTHIDCTPDSFDQVQHKLRYVFQGEVGSLTYNTNAGDIPVHEIDKPFCMDGSWPHYMINNTDKRKYTLAIGSPWVPDMDDAWYSELLERSANIYEDYVIRSAGVELPDNYEQYFGNMDLKDILLVSIPLRGAKYAPLPAIYHLRSMVEKHKFKVDIIDGHNIVNFQGKGYDYLVDMLRNVIHHYRYIGISVFTDSEYATALKILSNLNIDYDKVLWGGQGTSLIRRKLEQKDLEATTFCKNVIYGEGENAIIEFLKGNMDYPGINKPGIQIQDIEELPPPDYTGYMFKRVALTGSRGCVRKCKFCNVPLLWKKYKHVGGEKLAQNAIATVATANTNHIIFSDSLINGSSSEFIKMCKTLKEYNDTHPDDAITWEAQYIFKKPPKDPDYYKTVIQSGCKMLKVGIETGSEELRVLMDKKFSNAHTYTLIDGYLNNTEGFYFAFMYVVGYPDETEAHFEETLDMIERLIPYRMRIKMSPTMMEVLPETPVTIENPELLDGITDGHFYVNENSTFRERMIRYIKFETLLKHHKFAYEELIAKRIFKLQDLTIEYRLDYLELYKEAVHQLVNTGRLPTDFEYMDEVIPWDKEETFTFQKPVEYTGEDKHA